MTQKLNPFIVLFVLVQSFGFAQEHPFSNEVVINTYGGETMPFARGEVRRTQNIMLEFPVRYSGSYLPTLDKITDIVVRWDKLNPPQGFRATFDKLLDVTYDEEIYEYRGDDPLPHRVPDLRIIFEPYFVGDQGEPDVAEIGISASASLRINNPYMVAGSPIIAGIYLCPLKTADFYGFPIYETTDGEVTIIYKKQAPLFIPVTQEEYINAHISFWENEIAKNQTGQKIPENKRSVRETVDSEKAERQAALEKAYQEMLKYDKKAAEDLKKTMMEVESQLASRMATDPDAAYSKNDLLEKGNEIARQTIKALKAELAALSPEQRKKQAHYNVDAREDYNNHSGLVPFEKAKPRINCDPLIRINKNTVDANNPEPQLMVIKWSILFPSAKSHLSPRFFDDDEKRYRANRGDIGIAELYKQKDIWENVFDLIVE
ncbi:MAG: hypothetical protein PHI28_04035 [Mangrovibacterium sp.]|nr:hypothetical protein [Mangrovibacterium sp.]